MKTVLLTGAGASRPFGYPTTTEFFPNNRPDIWSETDWRTFEDVRRFLTAEQSPVDVEDVFGLLQPCVEFLKSKQGLFLRDILKIQRTNVDVITQLLTFLRKSCFDIYGKRPDVDAVKNAFIPLLDASGWSDSPVSLYTTNYDPVCDALMNVAEDMGLDSYDGFGRLCIWSQNKYDTVKTGIRIYHLHGCLSWVRVDDEIMNMRVFRRLTDDMFDDHLLIYPGFKGNPEDGGEEAFVFPHITIGKDLSDADRLIVIGFSFRDPHINTIIQNSLSVNDRLELISINPQNQFNGRMEADLSGYAPYAGRLRHIEEPFGSSAFLDELSGLA